MYHADQRPENRVTLTGGDRRHSQQRQCGERDNESKRTCSHDSAPTRPCEPRSRRARLRASLRIVGAIRLRIGGDRSGLPDPPVADRRGIDLRVRDQPLLDAGGARFESSGCTRQRLRVGVAAIDGDLRAGIAADHRRQFLQARLGSLISALSKSNNTSADRSMRISASVTLAPTDLSARLRVRSQCRPSQCRSAQRRRDPRSPVLQWARTAAG